jgi:hypothetical protein
MAINHLRTGMHISLCQTQDLNLFDRAITRANVTMSSNVILPGEALKKDHQVAKS